VPPGAIVVFGVTGSQVHGPSPTPRDPPIPLVQALCWAGAVPARILVGPMT